MNIIILISTPDARGLVHKISSNLLDFNIEKNDEFVDRESGQFFMRTEISLDSANSASCGDFSQLRSPRFLDEPCVLSSSLNSHNCENSSTILEFASCKNAESSNTIQSKKPFKSFCYFWLSPKVESSLLLNPNLPNNADSTESQNLVKNQSRVAQPLKASSGEGEGVVREGEGSDFAIQAPPPSLKKNARRQKGEFNADLSAQGREKIDSANPAQLISFDSFAKRAAPPTSLPLRAKKLRFFAFRGRASLSPLLAKNRRLHFCNLESDFLHHEAGEFSGASHGFNVDSANTIKNEIYHRLRAILPKNSFLKVTLKRKKSLIIFATKESHCLGDLLLKNYNNELNIEIKAVLSNHGDLGALVEKFNIPYFHISHDEANYEDKMLQICQDFAPDFIVLAKYMRILRPKFIAHYENRIINIHHSFLPAFIGANPYKQAYNRGVKIIGATAHFVTSELDSGPIICQDILQVNHTLLWRDMQKAGKNIERVVLARAVELAISERIFIHNNKTIIF